METAAPTIVYASGLRRLLAAAVDWLVVSFVSIPFVSGASQRFADAFVENRSPSPSDVARLSLVPVLVLVAYGTAMHTWRGATFGKIAARIVLVNDDGTRVSVSTAFVRAVAIATIFFASTFVASIPLLLNQLRPFWNRRRQTFHDSIARTVVVPADAIPKEVSSPL